MARASSSEAMMTASLRRIIDDYVKVALSSLEAEAMSIESDADAIERSGETSFGVTSGSGYSGANSNYSTTTNDVKTSATLLNIANTLRRGAEMIEECAGRQASIEQTREKQRLTELAAQKARRVSIDMISSETVAAKQQSNNDTVAAVAQSTTSSNMAALKVPSGPAATLSHPVRASGRAGRRPPTRRVGTSTSAPLPEDSNAVSSTAVVLNEEDKEALRQKREAFAAVLSREMKETGEKTSEGPDGDNGDGFEDDEGMSDSRRRTSDADKERKASRGQLVPIGSKALMGELSGVLLKKTSTPRQHSGSKDERSNTNEGTMGSRGDSTNGNENASQPEWMTKLKQNRKDEGALKTSSSTSTAGTVKTADEPPPGVPAWKWELEQRKAKQQQQNTSNDSNMSPAVHRSESSTAAQALGDSTDSDKKKPPPGVAPWKWELEQRKANQQKRNSGSSPSPTPASASNSGEDELAALLRKRREKALEAEQ